MKNTLISLRIDSLLWERFKAVAYQNSSNASTIIKELIKQYLDDNGELDDNDNELTEDYLEETIEVFPVITTWERGNTFKDVDDNIGRFIEYVDDEKKIARVFLAIGSSWKQKDIPVAELIQKLS